MTTFPVGFKALAAAVQSNVAALKDDGSFCVLLTGADRQAVIVALCDLEKLLFKGTIIEHQGYNFSQPPTKSMIICNQISDICGVFVASVQAVEMTTDVDYINVERVVGGLLAMARKFSDIIAQIEIINAENSMAKAQTPPANLGAKRAAKRAS